MNDRDDPTCGECAFFLDAGPDAPGSCWFNPPTAIGLPVAVPKNPIALPGGPGAQGAALATYALRPPVTADTMACGRFEGLESDDPSDAA
jgi:hypothetical protein